YKPRRIFRSVAYFWLLIPPPAVISSGRMLVLRLECLWLWLRFAFAIGAGTLVFPGQAQDSSNELGTAAMVRPLSRHQPPPQEQQRDTKVRLRGVVTFFEETLFSRFIQDETSGVYLFDSALPVHLLPGQLVEVEGTTSPGEYAPIVVPKKITVIGEAPLPMAK